ncbi:MAG: HvfX family Cu-binding RiPP maturation protein [Pseudomonadales bacterium]
MNKLASKYNSFRATIFKPLSHLEGIAPLLLRLYLVPTMWMAGSKKINFETFMPYQSTVDWFGDPDWGLGMPAPTLMAFLAGWTEVLGAIFLAVGFAVRWISIPLMFTMIVAATSVHIENGWQAIADPSGAFANERVEGSAQRLSAAKDILKEHGNYDWLTESGSFVILNNGIEFAATYFLMLLSLMFTGGGRYFSLDYWLGRATGLPRLGHS